MVSMADVEWIRLVVVDRCVWSVYKLKVHAAYANKNGVHTADTKAGKGYANMADWGV